MRLTVLSFLALMISTPMAFAQAPEATGAASAPAPAATEPAPAKDGKSAEAPADAVMDPAPAVAEPAPASKKAEPAPMPKEASKTEPAPKAQETKAAEAPAANATAAPEAMAASPASDADAAYATSCWRVDTPIEERVPMMPADEFQAHILQKGYGALTRRAAYNEDGHTDRLEDTQATQTDMKSTLLKTQVVRPIAVGVLGVVFSPVLAMVGVASATAWLVSAFTSVPLLNNRDKVQETFSYGVFLLAVVAFPLALVLGTAALVPLIVGVFKAVQYRKVPASPLLDQTGWTAYEAGEIVKAHNRRLAKRLGMAGPPECSGH